MNKFWLKPGPGFPMSYAVVLFIFNEVKVDCSFCWYWWNCWPSLLRPNKKICVYGHMSKKSRVGRSALIFFSFLLSAKPEIVVPGSRIRYFIFEISGKPSFVEAVLWRVMQFFYLLCSQFWQKASGWINKTLLLIKQQKWLSKFCAKIERVASKN